MPKLLSQEEANELASKMTAAYGLPPPSILEDYTYSSIGWSVKVVIYRALSVPKYKHKWLKKYTKVKYIQVRDFYANDYENALAGLESELNKLNGRTKTAELFREKFALEEATEALDDILQQS